MKFMKLGTRPDTFYTEEATRTVISDFPSDLVIKIHNITYLLHKIPVVEKCGLLQRLCSTSIDSDKKTIELNDIPGGEAAFELCAKYCYGITISLSAHNFVNAFCAAKFLRMNENVEKGNLVLKLEAFFNSCLLLGWKDSIATLQTTLTLPDCSHNLGITPKCIDSVIHKILTPPSQVNWSFTYTRPGYNKKHHHSVPKDWWTEDISDLDIDLFRCIIMSIRSTYILPPQLIGEALHVYSRRWLPDTTKTSLSITEESTEKSRRILETIVTLIPSDRGSVSVRFLLSLLSTGKYVGVSHATKTELLRRSSLQLDEATVKDLLFPCQLSSSFDDDELHHEFYDVELVESVLGSYLMQWRRQSPAVVHVENSHFLRSIRKVGKLVDSFLQVVAARDPKFPVSKFVHLAEALPDVSRSDHDDIYKAINTFLKEHPELSKADKKRLCRILDCQKLSAEVRAHAVKNERLPLRTVVQVLYFEQERTGSSATTQNLNPKAEENHLETISEIDIKGKLKLSPDEKLSRKGRDDNSSKVKTTIESEKKVFKGEIEEVESEKRTVVRRRGNRSSEHR